MVLQIFQKNLKMSFLRVPRVLLRVLGSSQIVLQISPITFYSKIKIQKTMVLQSFQKNLKMSFLRVPRVLFRVLDSSQIVLQISPITFYSKIKIQRTMVLESFQIIFENLISKSFKSSVQSSGFFSNSSTNKSNYILF